MVELNPPVDATYLTALVASTRAPDGIAMRKKGINDTHYLAPETVERGPS